MPTIEQLEQERTMIALRQQLSLAQFQRDSLLLEKIEAQIAQLARKANEDSLTENQVDVSGVGI